jgi:outer membrane lipoprotein-sorting protein
MVIVVADDTMTTFHPGASRAQKVKISANSRKLVGVFAGTQSLDELRAQFKITLSDPGAPQPYRLTLDPIHRTVKKKLQNLLLEVDRELMLPVVVEYLEADGDSTRYEFTSVEVNPEIEEAAFQLELGENVKVETIDATSGAS